MNLEAAKAALAHMDLDDRAPSVRAASRDFFWYSPVLKDRLDHVTADFVVRPRSEAEVLEVVKTCYAHDVPLTVRGAGTGNYGQAMPLEGGCVLHLRHMDEVKEVHPGRVVVEPGCLLKDLDAACQAQSGQELRMFSSTWATATIGGFIAGGSGGVGSCTWGMLRELGNIIRVRIVTMEAEPRILELRGEEINQISHAYGTNGIITEIEMPLAPAYDWVGIFLKGSDFAGAARFARDLAHETGILIKLASIFEAPIAKSYFQRVAPHVAEADALVGLMVAPHAMDAFVAFLSRYPDLEMIYRSDDHDWPRAPGLVFEYGWNHTTLRALKVDPSITYLQVGYGEGDQLPLIEEMRTAFSPEVLQHLEIMQFNGQVMFSGLSLVKFTNEERLEEIIAQHEAAGALVYNPHRYTLEEGGRHAVEETQLAFKRMADPKGLLNPGKMIEWDAPDWGYDEMYAYPKMQPRPEGEA